MARRRRKRWIQKAIRHEGALRATVLRIYGPKGFTSRGTIKEKVLRELKHSRNPKTRRRANLALILRRFRK